MIHHPVNLYIKAIIDSEQSFTRDGFQFFMSELENTDAAAEENTSTTELHQVQFLPTNKTITIDKNTTLREAAHLAGVSVHDRCGGMGACCNCVVTVVEGMDKICEKTVIEDAVFYLDANDRLSCQCKISGDVVLNVL